jgi:acyl carrier protein
VAGGENAIRRYLINLIESKTGALHKDLLQEDFELAQCGIDSLRASEIVNCINKELDLNITFSRLMHDNSMSGLVQLIDHMLWLRKQQPAGKEIIL